MIWLLLVMIKISISNVLAITQKQNWKISSFNNTIPNQYISFIKYYKSYYGSSTTANTYSPYPLTTALQLLSYSPRLFIHTSYYNENVRIENEMLMEMFMVSRMMG